MDALILLALAGAIVAMVAPITSDTLDALLTGAETKLGEIDDLRGKHDAAETDEERATLAGQIASAETEYGALEGKIDGETTALERRSKLAGLKAKNTTQSAGNVAVTEPLTAKDYDEELKAKTDAFYKHVQGKRLEGVEYGLVAPTSILGKSEQAEGGVVMPPSLATNVFGKRWGYMMGVLEPLSGKVVTSGTPVTLAQTGGAALIGPDFRPNLLELPPEGPHLVQRATIVPAPGGQAAWPRLTQTDANEYGGVAVQWIGEGAEKPESEPEFTQMQILCHEAAAYTEITHRLLSRSQLALEAILARLYRGAIMSALDQVMVNGTGSGQPLGIVPTTNIRLVTRQTAGTVTYRDLVRLKHGVLPHHRQNATFVMGDDVEQALEELVDTTGRPLFKASMANGPYDRCVGYPYEVSTRMLTIGAKGDIVYGNWREYILAMEEEVVVKRSDHFKFQQNRAAFAVFMVVGGRCVQPRAFSVLTGTS